MGRSATGLVENMVGFDPYTYAQRRQQLFNAPVTQATNPYEKMGAALANIAGASLFNLEDPNLKRASDIQNIYSDVMAGSDPTQPDFADRLGILTQRLGAAGYGDAAMYAANQARVMRREAEADTRAERTLGLSEARLKIELDNLERQKVLTDAQVKEITARIGQLEADKYSFQPIKDVSGAVTGVLAINKSNPSDVRTIPIGPTAAAAGTNPADAARKELERRSKGKSKSSASTAAPELDLGVSP